MTMLLPNPCKILIHNLTPETQLLAAIGYGTDLNFLCIRDQLRIIFDRKVLCFVFFKGCVTHSLNGKMH